MIGTAQIASSNTVFTRNSARASRDMPGRESSWNKAPLRESDMATPNLSKTIQNLHL